MVVKVKKEIVEIVNHVLNSEYYKNDKLKFLKMHKNAMNKTYLSWNKINDVDVKILNNLNEDELLNIIFNQYEIEETVEERLLNYYNQAKLNLDHFDPDVVTFYKGYISAFDIVLDNLNVKIEGINK